MIFKVEHESINLTLTFIKVSHKCNPKSYLKCWTLFLPSNINLPTYLPFPEKQTVKLLDSVLA